MEPPTSQTATSSLQSPVHVMVVDDSLVVRKLFTDLLDSEPDINVVATAKNGQEAIDKLADKSENLDIDVITMDVEMPVMDGISALPEVLKLRKHLRVVMISSLTSAGADKAMEALRKGATDCVGKPSADSADSLEDFKREVLRKVRALGQTVARRKRLDATQTTAAPAQTPAAVQLKPREIPMIRALAIASSTGGPQALSSMFAAWKGHQFRVPVFITQHMPPKFTTTLAKQLATVSGMDVREAEDGEAVVPGRVYVAPGGHHMTVARRDGDAVIALNQEPLENFCRPAADPMLRSLVDLYGRNMLLTVLTGMGMDGLKGAQKLDEMGGVTWAQDRESSVVWGMPGAVAGAGLCQKLLPLNDIPRQLSEAMKRQNLWQ